MFCKINAWIWIVIVILMEVLFICFLHIRIEKRIEKSKADYSELTKQYEMISKDLERFPINVNYLNDIHFEDTFYAEREQGAHEGCDILYTDNISGVVPIVSATDGIITNLGWLHLGGYRVGITSENGIYYYYAHMDTYSPRLHVGYQINAGEFLGFMGNTGEGPEGTEGKFPVHLHFGIYIRDKNGNEKAMNPYRYLLKINQE